MTGLDEKRALVAIGSSLRFGEMAPEAIILAAIARLKSVGLRGLRVSRLFHSPCFPPGSGPDYVNAAASVTWRHAMTPEELLTHLHRIEADFGRDRQQRWGPRTLDLDLLAVGDSVLPDAVAQDHWRNLPIFDQSRQMPDRLILPHPRLQDRAFVLVPLAEIAPDWVHPRLGLTVKAMLERLPAAEVAAIVPKARQIAATKRLSSQSTALT